MTEPTAGEIERVAVAIASAEMRIAGFSEVAVSIAETYARDVAVDTYGPAARAAIIAIRETVQ
ncbi:hypothetical protein [Brevundimonas sp. Root1279]|uniref:hypothetical protein n=1 Tax=Brevundimonas sp. Root1279 TaxID=1736443 RepID=UPI0006F6EE49|nr:hypothetical protein [Brevundimonas sp. Root1279]